MMCCTGRTLASSCWALTLPESRHAPSVCSSTDLYNVKAPFFCSSADLYSVNAFNFLACKLLERTRLRCNSATVPKLSLPGQWVDGCA